MSTEPRVLIIEDNDALRVMFFTILRHQPLAVDTATSADDAMQRVRTCDYALILLDMDLAGGDADDFLRRFQEERPGISTFILAVRDPKKETTVSAEVVSAVLNKPLEIDTLAEVVRECALVVPPPDDPLTTACPPAESDVRAAFDRGSYYTN